VADEIEAKEGPTCFGREESEMAEGQGWAKISESLLCAEREGIGKVRGDRSTGLFFPVPAGDSAGESVFKKRKGGGNDTEPLVFIYGSPTGA
jgi:hypothetical protein